jgi:hypothetical protein
MVSAKRPVVLLVNDDPLMLDLLEVEFTEAGFDLVIAGQGFHALAEVVTNWMMMLYRYFGVLRLLEAFFVPGFDRPGGWRRFGLRTGRRRHGRLELARDQPPDVLDTVEFGVADPDRRQMPTLFPAMKRAGCTVKNLLDVGTRQEAGDARFRRPSLRRTDPYSRVAARRARGRKV